MYAVIETGGQQFRVEVGDVVRVARLTDDVGSAVVFDRVLMLGGDEGDADVKLGTPTLDGTRVRGTVLAQERDRKVLVYTFKRRKNSARKRQGHRQSLTAVKIEAIDA
jgi:large subunit ribosomal protein L21